MTLTPVGLSRDLPFRGALGLVTVMYTAQLGYEKGLAGASIGVLMALAIWIVGRTGFVIGPLRPAVLRTIRLSS